eukprot:gb/GEZN01000520.1/.p1 GENE.gb/GEZN01000520.1/~~gb/GEZN01000520.1/.p1  ORF type:complete len:1402 (+),score=227.88 gb/GEZN01000520.1/:231-4208(+)
MRRRLSLACVPDQTKLNLDGVSDPYAPPAVISSTEQIARSAWTKFAMISHVGYVPFNKGKVNQDRVICDTAFASSSSRAFCGVFDGHGENGHWVSTYVSKVLPTAIEFAFNEQAKGSSKQYELIQLLQAGFLLTCRKLERESGIDCTFSGTTACTVYIQGNEVYCCNVGDSRAVLGRRDRKGDLWAIPLSLDQKPDREDEYNRIKQRGGRVEQCRDEEGNYVGPQRLWVPDKPWPGLAMSRSFGDFIARPAGITSLPEIRRHELEPGDEFIIVASDGVWELISNAEAVSVVAHAQGDPRLACELLFRESDRRWREEEEVVDDISALVIYLNPTAYTGAASPIMPMQPFISNRKSIRSRDKAIISSRPTPALGVASKPSAALAPSSRVPKVMPFAVISANDDQQEEQAHGEREEAKNEQVEEEEDEEEHQQQHQQQQQQLPPQRYAPQPFLPQQQQPQDQQQQQQQQQQQFQHQQQQHYYQQQQQQQEQPQQQQQQSPQKSPPRGGFPPNSPIPTVTPGVFEEYTSEAPAEDPRIDEKQIPRQREAQRGAEVIRFETRSQANPPPAFSEYTVIDQGNCSPRFMRLTTNQIAVENEIIEKTKLCIGAIIQPLAKQSPTEEPIAVVDFPKHEIVRCTRCKTYVNPFFTFIEGGNTYICNMCGMTNSVPDEYKCNLDAHGLRRDRTERPELSRGSVEFVAGKEFNLREIQDPCYLFMIDVSYGAVQTGLVAAACYGIRVAINTMKNNPRTRVGVVTYDSAIQFYALRPGKDDFQLMLMTDVNDVFLPVPEEQVLVRINEPEAFARLDNLLAEIPRMYSAELVPQESANCAGAAVAAGLKTLQKHGGKLMLLVSNIPTVGSGSLKSREGVNLYFSAKEKSLFVPQDSFYEELASEFADARVGVNLFVCANAYVDLATLSSLTTKTGGQIFLYPGFDGKKDGESLWRDILSDATRPMGFDAVMIVRASSGLKVTELFGNFYRRNPNELDLPIIDCDKTFGVRVEHEGKITDKEACLQCALLYTTAQGERRIRVHTLSVPTTSTLQHIFRSADLDSIINLSLKQAVTQIHKTFSPDESKQALVQACIESLYIYRRHVAASTRRGQLILPEQLKLLPQCTLALIKHPLFQFGLSADERSFFNSQISSMPCSNSVVFVVPRLFDLTAFPDWACVQREDGRVFLPPTEKLSSTSLDPTHIYILDDSRYLYLWVGENVSEEILTMVFGNSHLDGQYTVVQSDDPNSFASRINLLLETLRQGKAEFQNLQVIARQQVGRSLTLDEKNFRQRLVEDALPKKTSSPIKAKDKSNQPHQMSYIDFLVYIHQQIQDKSSQF